MYCLQRLKSTRQNVTLYLTGIGAKAIEEEARRKNASEAASPSSSKSFLAYQQSTIESDTRAASLVSEIDRLRYEKYKLREENQRLRRLLASYGVSTRVIGEALNE